LFYSKILFIEFNIHIAKFLVFWALLGVFLSFLLNLLFVLWFMASCFPIGFVIRLVIILSVFRITCLIQNTYLQIFCHCTACLSFRFLASDYPFGNFFKRFAIVLSVLSVSSFWFSDWYHQTSGHCIVCPVDFWLMIIHLVSSGVLPLYCLSFRFLASGYTFWYLQASGHCIVCPIDVWYLQTFLTFYYIPYC